VGRFTSLALDSAGGAHVAYYDATSRGLKYAHRDGFGAWTNESFVMQDVGTYASLAVDPLTQLPAIAYFDARNGSLGFVEQLVNGTWEPPVTVDDPANAVVGVETSLAFDPAGDPAIAYQDVTNLDLKFANRTGSWRSTTLRSDWHTGFNNSLEFDASGHPHIAFYSYVTQRSSEDLVVVGTETGQVYAVDVSIPGTVQRGNREKQVADWDYRVRWNVSLGSEVHIAASPLVKPEGSPRYSPAFSKSGSAVFVGTEDGRLFALNASNGGNYWWNASQQHVPMGSPWRSPPVVYLASSGPEKDREIVYATTGFVDSLDADSSPESLLVARHASDGSPLGDWQCTFPGYDGGAFMGPTLAIPDGGNLTQPVIDADIIYVASDSGRLYAIRRDGIGDCGDWLIPPASQKWMYRDLTLIGLDAKFTSPPVVFSDRLVLIAAASHNNGTASDPLDDKGVLYSLRVDQGNVSWKRTLPSPVNGMPQIWSEQNSRALLPAVWATYGGGPGRVSGVISLSVVGQFLAPSEPSWAHQYICGTQTNPRKMCAGYPSGNQYWLGLDSQGRDIFSQVIWGSRIALLVGFLSAFFTVLVGVVVGLIAGYVGGKTEAILMRFTDVILVLPGLPLIITLAAVLGASIWNIILVISLLGWPGVARIIRAEVLSLKERPFIDSARVTGASTTRIVFRHIAPNVMPLAFLYMTFSVSGAILTEAALSFIGLGDIATMSWGIMLQLVSQSDALRAWWWLLPPGLAITLISLAFFLVGRAFDEIVNPRLRKR
jgi:peptide/nickel transport system permease protein